MFIKVVEVENLEEAGILGDGGASAISREMPGRSYGGGTVARNLRRKWFPTDIEKTSDKIANTASNVITKPQPASVNVSGSTNSGIATDPSLYNTGGISKDIPITPTLGPIKKSIPRDYTIGNNTAEMPPNNAFTTNNGVANDASNIGSNLNVNNPVQQVIAEPPSPVTFGGGDTVTLNSGIPVQAPTATFSANAASPAPSMAAAAAPSPVPSMKSTTSLGNSSGVSTANNAGNASANVANSGASASTAGVSGTNNTTAATVGKAGGQNTGTQAGLGAPMLEWLYNVCSGQAAGSAIGGGITDATVGPEALSIIQKNIGENFSQYCTWLKDTAGSAATAGGGAISDFAGMVSGGISKVHGWLTGNVFKGSDTLSKHIGNNMASPTYGTVLAWGLVSSVVLMAGFRFVKGFYEKDDDNNFNQEESARIMNDSLSHLNEISLIIKEGSNYSEGIFDVFSWLGRLLRKAFDMVGEILRTIKKGLTRHPIMSSIILVCCFFVLFCVPKGEPITTTIAHMFGQTVQKVPGK